MQTPSQGYLALCYLDHARPVGGSARWSIENGNWKRSMGQSTWPKRFAIARPVAEIFFPQRPQLGLDQRNCIAAVLDKIMSANAVAVMACVVVPGAADWAA